jgi:hypothetical protein
MKKSLIITIISIIILALIGTGVFWYFNKYQVTSNNNQNNENEPVAQNEGGENSDNIEEGNEKEDIDTSNWLTYRNEEYGFEVKYPEEFIYDKRSTIEEALFLTFNSKNNINNDIFITLLSFILQEHHKIAIEAQLKTESCVGSKNNYICYFYRKEDNRFLRNDVIVKNNKKYNFTIFVNGASNLSPTENIDLFLQNQFSPQDQNIINILDQMKASMIFF